MDPFTKNKNATLGTPIWAFIGVIDAFHINSSSLITSTELFDDVGNLKTSGTGSGGGGGEDGGETAAEAVEGSCGTWR